MTGCVMVQRRWKRGIVSSSVFGMVEGATLQLVHGPEEGVGVGMRAGGRGEREREREKRERERERERTLGVSQFVPDYEIWLVWDKKNKEKLPFSQITLPDCIRRFGTCTH